jgi:hypothetical protein
MTVDRAELPDARWSTNHEQNAIAEFARRRDFAMIQPKLVV